MNKAILLHSSPRQSMWEDLPEIIKLLAVKSHYLDYSDVKYPVLRVGAKQYMITPNGEIIICDKCIVYIAEARARSHNPENKNTVGYYGLQADYDLNSDEVRGSTIIDRDGYKIHHLSFENLVLFKKKLALYRNCGMDANYGLINLKDDDYYPALPHRQYLNMLDDYTTFNHLMRAQ